MWDSVFLFHDPGVFLGNAGTFPGTTVADKELILIINY